MKRYTKQVQCHTYPSRAALLKLWASEEGVSVSKYFRDVIASHVFKRSGYATQASLPLAPQRYKKEKTAPKYPRVMGFGYVYLIRCGDSYKIGRAVDVLRRLGVMSLPMRPEIIAVKCCADYGPLEKDLHKRFAASRTYGEWFNFSEEQLTEVKKHFQ